MDLVDCGFAGFREVSGLVHVSDGRVLVLARRSCGPQCVDAEGLWVGGDEVKVSRLDIVVHCTCGGKNQSEVKAV